MQLRAWCGHCGESFGLAELVERGFTGRCPRCGFDLASGYAPVASAAVHDLLAAVATLEQAAERLAETAPHLHIDTRSLSEQVAASLGDS
jgi:uncharacterized paraquat-inducible protein A